MLRTIEMKCYPTPTQTAVLSSWMARCCWIYNRALDHRIKAYKRRPDERVNYNSQSKLLTIWRSRMSNFADVPAQFCREPIRRVDRGFQAFFRRCKAGEKPGFPRFKNVCAFNSIEAICLYNYVRGNKIAVPKLGCITIRGAHRVPVGKQKQMRIIRRPSGWYCQVLVEVAHPAPLAPTGRNIGIDVGLTHFAALSNGELIANPRFGRWSERKIRSAQRRKSRRVKGSKRRRNAVRQLGRLHEMVNAQRKDFAHQLSTDLIRRFDLIAVENLNIKGMVRSRMARSISDAAWGMLIRQLVVKAANAGRQVVLVDPRGTSQTCPSCGAVRRKNLSERVHVCPCGHQSDRDVAAAQVILARALGVAGVVSPVEELASGCDVLRHRQVGPVKREDIVTTQDRGVHFLDLAK